eukprot:9110478-Lingulodinium_polyedra.AAC.2
MKKHPTSFLTSGPAEKTVLDQRCPPPAIDQTTRRRLVLIPRRTQLPLQYVTTALLPMPIQSKLQLSSSHHSYAENAEQ